MLIEKIKKYNLILASNSPRRKFLLHEAGFKFTINVPKEIDESFPTSLTRQKIPIYLAKLKANSFSKKLLSNDILITADTIVWIDNKVINKPENREEAIKMIKALSNNTHQVYTGVCIKSKSKLKSFYSRTDVTFKNLSINEIEYYVDYFKPYDKAGAYGIQEWIGYIGIEKIKGSYFNVMGLPIQKLYNELNKFIEN